MGVKKESSDVIFQGGTRRVFSAILKGSNDNNGIIYSQKIAKITDITYSHIVRLRNILMKRGLVEKCEKQGRMLPLKFTDKGKQIAELFEKINKLVE